MYKQKKAQLTGLPMVIITLILAAMLLIMGLLLLNGFITSTDNYSGTVVNETTGWINSSGYTLAQANIAPGFNSPSITAVFNKTTALTTANYTLVGNRIYNASPNNFYLGTVNISYTYKYGGESYLVTNKSIEGTASFADFWEIIVLAVVITIILGIILAVMSQKRVK